MKRRHSTENLERILRMHGVTPTRQRIEVARALYGHGSHPSAEEIFRVVNRRWARASKATVYNTLNLFLAKKLIRQVLVDRNRVLFDPNLDPHHHLYHVETGELMDIDATNVQVTGLPALPRGLVSDGFDVVVRVRSASKD